MPDEPGVATPVLLLHGFTHTGASWGPVGDELPAGTPTLIPDIRGHGSSAERRPVDLAGVMADLAELLDERSTVVGYSMGGRLALHLAFAQSAFVDRLVLVGASPGLADTAEREARWCSDEALADEIERSTIGEFATRWAQTPVLAGLPPSVAERTHRDRLRSTPAGLAAALRGLGTGALPSLWPRLPELKLPVTLVVGQRDQKFRDVAEAMAGSLPHARVVVVPGAGHAVHLEAPGRLAEVISGDR